MNIIIEYLCRYKWVLSILGVILILVNLGFWASRRVTQDLKSFAFQSYISLEYMPSQRKQKGQWPVTLNDLLKQIKNSDYVAKNEIADYYQKGFIKLEPIQACPNSYVYRIFTTSGSKSCKVTISPDSGRCWDDSK